MAGWVMLAFFSAFGVLCAVWVLFGWLLPVCREGQLVYFGGAKTLTIVPVYLWLRSLGLVKCPLILIDSGFDEARKAALRSKGIELYSLTELPSRLGIGAEIN